MNDYEEFARWICKVLKVPMPRISQNKSLFLTGTMKALYVSEDDTIYLQTEGNPLDIYFAIAHELRHCWQLKDNEEYWFGSYKSADKIGNISYNLQPAEIDANAFGTIIMSELFGVQAQFNDMVPKVKRRILERMEEIEKQIEV